MEGVNPYHWEKNQWTPENIKAVAEDLAADSVDGVFEECFEVKPEVFKSLARTLKSKNVKYISGTDPDAYSGNPISQHCGRKQHRKYLQLLSEEGQDFQYCDPCSAWITRLWLGKILGKTNITDFTRQPQLGNFRRLFTCCNPLPVHDQGSSVQA